jgi:hypothetical protein
MAIDEETKRRIIDLVGQHKTIRQIAKIVNKSSRDVVAVIKQYNQKPQISNPSKPGDSTNDNRNQEKDEPDNYPVNAKAYRLFSQKLTPIDVSIRLALSEPDATKYYIEYLRLQNLTYLPEIFRSLSNVKEIGYFVKLSKLARIEGLTPRDVIRLLNISGPLSSIEKRRDEAKGMLLMVEKELDEKASLLNEIKNKTVNAKLNNELWKKENRELRDEVVDLRNEKSSLLSWIHELKQNNNTYLEVQNVVKEKVEEFLSEYNGRKLLEYALTAAVEALRQDSEKELSAEKMSTLTDYDFDPEKLFFPNPYNPSDLKKERLLELASIAYNKLFRGLTDVAISTAAKKYTGTLPY